MLRQNITQNQCEIQQRNKLFSDVPLGCVILEPSFIIKIMVQIIKIKSKDSMDEKTHAVFSKITDAVVQMAEEIRE